MLFARVSNNKYGVGDIFERERLELSVSRVQQKAKLKGRGPMLEEMRPDHAIRNSIAITKLPLCCNILKKKKKNKNNKKEKCIFENIFFLDFLTF